MDREKVIKGLHDIGGFIAGRIGIEQARNFLRTIDDTVVLLKEQEVVSVHDPGAYCPKCGWMLYPEDHPHCCGNCGQAVKWE